MENSVILNGIKEALQHGEATINLKEASALTGSGSGVGGRVIYDDAFASLRLANPLRKLSRIIQTIGSDEAFVVKTGNATLIQSGTDNPWGYPINNNTGSPNISTSFWQLPVRCINASVPVRTAVLSDINYLEETIAMDLALEFSQQEGLSMIQNDDQAGSTTTSTGGTNGLRGLNYYPGANGSYAGGTTSAYGFGTSGTGATAGLNSIATYDQITTNGFGTANHVSYADLINFLHALPQQYWSNGNKWMISPLMLAGIRGLVDDNGTPVFERMAPLVTDGIVGKLLGYDVVVNNYVDSPVSAGGSAGTADKFPIYFGDFTRGHTIVDRLNMVLRRYDQTLPGYITFFGEKRLATSVVDPFSIIRYRSTATAT